jgi:hypothetical protein
MEQKRRGRPRKIPEMHVDWEALAKNLQLALEREVDDTEQLQKKVDQLSANVLKLMGVIEYLELKNGNPKL